MDSTPIQPQAHKPTLWAALAAAALGLFAAIKPNPAPIVNVVTPPTAETAVASIPACSQPAIGDYQIWKLATYNKACVKGQKLPSGQPFGDPYRCRQGNVEYPGTNPFHSGDQPLGCGDASKNPYTRSTIKWDGVKFVNTTIDGGTGGSGSTDTRSCYPTGTGASGELYHGPCVVTPTCQDLGGGVFASKTFSCKAPGA